jgi:uncharacterized protein DUF4145
MIIECHYCESRVDAKVLASHDSFDENDPSPFRATLLECPGCNSPLLAGQYAEGETAEGDQVWEAPVRVWPAPDRYVSWEVPAIVRTSIEEAERCFKAKAYTACAVMCGRALEGVARHFKTKSAYLAGGLKELAERKIIDARLLEWSEALRTQRNAAAHASTEKGSRDDARDVLDFAHGISEYVFVLSARYERFRKRQSKEPKASGKTK